MELSGKFTHFMKRYCKQPSPVLLCVSGGSDSLALASMFSKEWSKMNKDFMETTIPWSKEFAEYQSHYPVHVLIINHNVRPEAEEESRMIQSLLKGSKFGFQNVHVIDMEWGNEKKNQKIYRDRRKGLINEFCHQNGIKKVFTGHHRNDKIETWVQRLAFKSGLKGLTSIQPKQEMGDLTIYRPFIDVDKKDLIHHCKEHSIPYVSDPTNFKLTESRGLIRKRLAEWESIANITPEELNFVISHFQKIWDLSLGNTLDFWSKFCNLQYGIVQIDEGAFKFLPKTIAMQILLRAVSMVRGMKFESHTAKLAMIWENIKEGKLVTAFGCNFVPSRGKIYVSREVFRLNELNIPKDGSKIIWDGRLKIKADISKCHNPLWNDQNSKIVLGYPQSKKEFQYLSSRLNSQNYPQKCIESFPLIKLQNDNFGKEFKPSWFCPYFVSPSHLAWFHCTTILPPNLD